MGFYHYEVFAIVLVILVRRRDSDMILNAFEIMFSTVGSCLPGSIDGELTLDWSE